MRLTGAVACWLNIAFRLVPDAPSSSSAASPADCDDHHGKPLAALVQAEEKATGTVALSVYKAYWMAIGGCLAATILIFVALMQSEPVHSSLLIFFLHSFFLLYIAFFPVRELRRMDTFDSTTMRRTLGNGWHQIRLAASSDCRPITLSDRVSRNSSRWRHSRFVTCFCFLYVFRRGNQSECSSLMSRD